jgi:hypothetical protein
VKNGERAIPEFRSEVNDENHLIPVAGTDAQSCEDSQKKSLQRVVEFVDL